MAEQDPQWSDDTLLVHDERHSEGAVSPPIYQTSLFTFESYQAMVDRFRGKSTRAVYSRIDNPACGEMVGGVFSAGYPGGSGLTSGAVFGRIAGRSAARCRR